MKIIEAEACPDHIHLFVEIPPKIAISKFMGYLSRGYYVDTVGKNESRIAEYIKNQLKEDELGEQLRIPSPSPFTGSK